jgi:hypothetical protein
VPSPPPTLTGEQHTLKRRSVTPAYTQHQAPIFRNRRAAATEELTMVSKIWCKVGVAGLAALALLGCAKEVGRVPFSREGTNSASLPLASGRVVFWTELDLKYEGDAALKYRIDLLQAGSRVATAVCDPLAELPIKIGWFEMRRGAARSLSGHGEMACSANLHKAGPTTVEATLAFDIRPTALSLGKADLVIKQ